MPRTLEALRPTLCPDPAALVARLVALAEDEPPLQAETLAAVRQAVDLRAFAQLGALADASDPEVERRRAFADGPLAAASERALRRVVRVRPADDTDPADARWLRSLTRRAPAPLSAEAEAVLADLGEHGGRAWCERWRRIAGEVRRALGPPIRPATQAEADERMRAVGAAWSARGHDVAEVATHVVGWRLGVAASRRTDPLGLALADDVVRPDTLAAMLEACRAARPALWRWSRSRSALLAATSDGRGVPPRGASLPGRGESVPIGSAYALVEQAFAAFSPRLGAFVARARDEGWVDEEPRPTKRPPATCAHFVAARESRIVLEYDGSPAAVVTLAHELGHAYHADVLFRRGPSAIDVPVTLAEGASLVTEGLARVAVGGEDRLAVLDAWLAGAAKWMLDAAQTYQLEAAMVALRRQGPLDPAVLEETAAACFREWFGPDVPHPPAYWAWQAMIYQPDRGFLAVPYLVAFLFASRVLAEAAARGPAWADTWDELLLDCEDGSVEELATRYLDVDPASPEAWRPVAAEVERAADAFEALARERR